MAARIASENIFRYAFDGLGLERVYLNVLQENTRAVRFYNKLGDLGLKYYETSTMEFRGEKKALLWYEVRKIR